MSNRNIAKTFIWTCLIVLGIFIIRISIDGLVFWSTEIDYSKTGLIGDFIGGVIGTIISAAGFYFLYLTFYEQRSSFERERLESKFFDLVKLQRENVSELSFDASEIAENYDSLFIEKNLYQGKSVFKVVFNQFIMCRNELRPFFKRKKMFLPEYEKQMMSNNFFKNSSASIKEAALIDICFSIVFYGLSSEGLLILNSIFKTKYKPNFIKDILRYVSLKPAKDTEIFDKWLVVSNRNTRGKKNEIVRKIYDWRKYKSLNEEFEFNDTVENYHNRYIKYYGGHQFRLGHYFRHLYQVVKFINNQKGIDYNEKYGYLKILRAQLSTYEQAVLFLNSISSMGQSWELQPEINPKLNGFKDYDFKLITKYNFIKNIPGDSMYGINFKDFYPLVEYESEQNEKKRPKYH
ncbi:putative phage abortive infection protein [Luteirhabdus pelagi]|uniref:putative phage abortive infection protein n=1 Tax=Luteirhabdus pelagi TaxID=2792783 RepID=UPI001939A4F4|nr:putative phage abortive infection protein [Luteirhabdus pelagi]